MKTSRRLLFILLAVALVASSCGRFARRGSAEPEASSTVKQEYGAGVTAAPTAVRKLGKTGTLRIRVIDNSNRVVVGAIVRYKGPKNGRAVTDSKGIAKAAVPQGDYIADIAPCGTRVVTKDYRTAAVFVPRGGTAGGDIDGIGWERRYKPTPSVRAKPDAPWKVGESVDIAVRIEDGCTFEAAKNIDIPEFAWKTSSTFGLRSTPKMRSDKDGFAHATITCRSEGNGTVEIYDRAFPRNSVDAIAALSVPEGGNFCEK